MKREVIAQIEPKSPVSEIFRTLRTNIQFMNTSKGMKTLLVTSTMPGEGKSWVTCNLAVTFAQAGKKVIIIDSDMRKGRQHLIFDVNKKPGLSNYLSSIDEFGINKEVNIVNYIRETEVENLFLIPAGDVPPNPSELLVSERMLNMIEELKEIFDLIIFDSTPSEIVTDAIILSRFVDSTIIVTEHKATKTEALKRIKTNIENVGGKIAGIIINKQKDNTKKYNGEYYYYGDKKRKRKDNSFVKKAVNDDLKALMKTPKPEEKMKSENNDNILKKIANDREKEISDVSKENKQEVKNTTTEVIAELNKYIEQEKAKLNENSESNYNNNNNNYNNNYNNNNNNYSNKSYNKNKHKHNKHNNYKNNYKNNNYSNNNN